MIIFGRTRHEYASYSDFWKLVELSGFPVRYIDEIDPDSDDTFIITPMNGEVQGLYPGWRTPTERRAQIIWWFLERLDSTPMLSDGSFERHRQHFDQVWVSDRWMAAQHGVFRHVVLGSHPNFGNAPTNKAYDFTHQSYVCGRRNPVYTKIRALGLCEGPNAWGAERNRILCQSRVMVHVQQFHLPLYTPLRFAIAAAYHMPLVSETLHDPYPLDASSLVQTSLAQLPSTVQQTCRNLGLFGEKLYEKLCVERNFRREVENAL